MLDENIKKLLDRAWKAYDNGKPFMTDTDFDALSIKYNYNSFGSLTFEKKSKHLFQMHSLKKVYDNEDAPYVLKESVESPKLDGTAISLRYNYGYLVQALRRGRDGIEGEDVTDKMLLLVPNTVKWLGEHQVEGEVVCHKDISNARNYASGAFGLKDIEEFKTRVEFLTFVAYGIKPVYTLTYKEDMQYLREQDFNTVLTPNISENFRTDGKVYRENDNALFRQAGYTSKHPRGAYARKLSKDVAIETTTLLDVTWQVGRTGKVSPVALFKEIIIDDAKITRATLHNPGFIEDMLLEIGDTILVTRSGGVIPKVVGKL